MYITLPNNLHFQVAKKALENNKHVLVEKAALLKSERNGKIREFGFKNRLLLAEGFFLPTSSSDKRVIDDN